MAAIDGPLLVASTTPENTHMARYHWYISSCRRLRCTFYLSVMNMPSNTQPAYAKATPFNTMTKQEILIHDTSLCLDNIGLDNTPQPLIWRIQQHHLTLLIYTSPSAPVVAMVFGLKIFNALQPSKGERYGIKGKRPPPPDLKPNNNTHVTSPCIAAQANSAHLNDQHMFNPAEHQPISEEQPDDELGRGPRIPPGVATITSTIFLPPLPGLQEIQQTLQKGWEIVQNMTQGESEIRDQISGLKDSYSALLEAAQASEPYLPRSDGLIKTIRIETSNMLALLESWDRKDRSHRMALLQRLERCDKGYVELDRRLNSAQNTAILTKCNLAPNHIPVQSNKLQADEAQLREILRREINQNIPREIITQKQIWSRTAHHIHTNGGFLVYQGTLVDKQHVAIKMSQKKSPLSEAGKNFGRRVLRHASTWASFSSPYILPFLGMGVEILEAPQGGSQGIYRVFFVSPWLKDGDAVKYISNSRKEHLHVDAAKLVRDVALGLQYLHTLHDPCIHASVRGENVLIKRDHQGSEQACLNGFALSKAKVRNEGRVEFTGEDNVWRWRAPELMMETAPLETSSDIYSWAMTALELYSGLEPFHKFEKQSPACDAIIQGRRPQRADHPDFEKCAPQPEETWALLERCWNGVPEQRPTIQEVLVELDRIGTSTS